MIGVPLRSRDCRYKDSLFSMVRMPPGMPVAVPGLGESGLQNAALYAAQIIALLDPEVADKLKKYNEHHKKEVKINIEI